MQKFLCILLTTVFGIFLVTGSAFGLALSNQRLFEVEYENYFPASFDAGALRSSDIQFGLSGGVVGTVYSGVSKSNRTIDGSYYYAYFYAVDLNANTDTQITSLAVDWGTTRPYSFHFINPTADSWYGRADDGWGGAFGHGDIIGNNNPSSADYSPTYKMASWSWPFDSPGGVIRPGEESSWMILMSTDGPGMAGASVVDEAALIVRGDVYVPTTVPTPAPTPTPTPTPSAVPEPTTLLLLGTGLLGLALIGRVKFIKK